MITTRYKINAGRRLFVTRTAVPRNLRNLAEQNQCSNLPSLKISNSCESLDVLLGGAEPDIEPEMQGRIQMCSNFAQRQRTQINFELPKISAVSSSEVRSVLLRKIELCTIICDFSANTKDQELINHKTAALKELIENVTPENADVWLSDTVQEKIEELVYQNLFRNNSIQAAQIATMDETVSFVNPSWEHNSLIYELLLKMLRQYKKAAKFSTRTLLLIIYLFNSPDQKERLNASCFVNMYSDVNPETSVYIGKQCIYMIAEYAKKKEVPFGISNALYFLNKKVNLIEELESINFHEVLIVIISLISTPHLNFYSEKLFQFLKAICTKHNKLLRSVILRIIRRFPVTDFPHQVLIISLINNLLTLVSRSQFVQIYIPVFRLYSRCAVSLSWKVSEASFLIWDIKQISAYIQILAKEIYPLIFDNIIKATRGENSNYLKTPGSNVLVVMNQLNPKEFNSVSKKSTRNQSKWSMQWGMVVELAMSDDSSFRAEDFKDAITLIRKENEKQKNFSLT